MNVGWAKVVTPFRDAVRLINSKADELILFVDSPQMLTKAFCKAELRGYVQQPGARMAATEIVQDGRPIGRGGVGVDGFHGDIGGLESGDLVVHQGKKGRDNNGDPMVEDSRKLKAEGFAKGRCSLVTRFRNGISRPQT